jgi:hypothetical protein
MIFKLWLNVSYTKTNIIVLILQNSFFYILHYELLGSGARHSLISPRLAT